MPHKTKVVQFNNIKVLIYSNYFGENMENLAKFGKVSFFDFFGYFLIRPKNLVNESRSIQNL